jgi:hypothetical protein
MYLHPEQTLLSTHYYKLVQVRLLLCCITLLSTQVYSQYFTTIRSDEGIEILEKGKKVLFYQQRPKSSEGKYERAGYVHPLYSLNEKILTEDFPEDHPYHRGIFWAWHQIVLNDKKIADGWICENISWKPVRLKVKKRKENIILQSEMIWNAKWENNNPTAIVKENTKITVYKSTVQYRAIDFDIYLFALVDNLKIGGSDDDKGYGGFCLRLKLPKDISFFSNNMAITPTETAITAGPWMDFIGSFDGTSMPKTGVAVFCSQPGRDQQLWILRKEASMQNIPYPGKMPIILSKKGLRLKYRIIIHNGDMSNDDLEKLYQQYIHKS